jgi:hypothetical protein
MFSKPMVWTILGVAALLAGAVPFTVNFARVDSCLDQGGAWDYQAAHCTLSTQPAAAIGGVVIQAQLGVVWPCGGRLHRGRACHARRQFNHVCYSR